MGTVSEDWDAFIKAGYVEVHRDIAGKDLMPPLNTVTPTTTEASLSEQRVGNINLPVQKLGGNGDKENFVVAEPVLPVITKKELRDLKTGTALLRTAVGDILYPVVGVDYSSAEFIVLYMQEKDLHFVPKSGKNYYLAVKINTTSGLSGFCSEVFYSGILFKLPESSKLSLQIMIFLIK